MIDADGLRSTFLAFFAERGHAILASASLIPERDPSVQFTTAGVHPLLPYLLGRPHPAGRLLADCQKCLRTTDIDQVGDTIQPEAAGPARPAAHVLDLAGGRRHPHPGDR
jgi:alanyl-tRNA synthetase